MKEERNSKRTREEREMEENRGKVCVTGASGFLASWLIKRLLLSGYRVTGTVRDPGSSFFLFIFIFFFIVLVLVPGLGMA